MMQETTEKKLKLDESPNGSVSQELLSACDVGTLPQVEAALANGADVNIICFDCWSPLLLACRRADATADAVVLHLLKAKANPNDEGDGTTALHLAAAWCSARVVKWLLKAGARADCKDKDGCIPLQLCCRRCDIEAAEIARLLLAAHQDQVHVTRAIFGACFESTADVVLELRQSRYFKAAVRNARGVIRSLPGNRRTLVWLENNQQLQPKDDIDGVTCLMAACGNRFGGAQIIRVLKRFLGKLGAAHCESMFYYAYRHGNGDIMSAVLSLSQKRFVHNPGAYIVNNYVDPLGVIQAIELHEPREFGLTNLIEEPHSPEGLWAFLRTGCPPRGVDDYQDGWDDEDPNEAEGFLDGAASITNLHAWKIIHRELSTYRQPTNGRTIMHFAAHKGNMDLLQVLMSRNENPFTPSRRGNLPIGVAANDTIRAALQEYMRWDPRRTNVMWWWGPLVRQRAFSFLLVVQHYNTKGFLSHSIPKDIIRKILEFMVANETIYLKRSKPLVEFINDSN